MFQGVVMNVVANMFQGFLGSDDVIVKQRLPFEVGMAVFPAPKCQGRFVGANN